MALCCFLWYWKTKPKLLVLKNQFRKVDSSHYRVQFSLVQFSRSVVSDSLRPHESQHTRRLCPSPTPRVQRLMSIESVMSPCPLILSYPLLLLPTIPPSIRVFSNESTLHMRGQSTGVSALASFLPMNTQG